MNSLITIATNINESIIATSALSALQKAEIRDTINNVAPSQTTSHMLDILNDIETYCLNFEGVLNSNGLTALHRSGDEVMRLINSLQYHQSLATNVA